MNTPTNYTLLKEALASLKSKLFPHCISLDSQQLLYWLEHAQIQAQKALKDYQICSTKLKELQQLTQYKNSEIKKIEKKFKKIAQQKKCLQEKIEAIKTQKKIGSMKLQNKYRCLKKSYAQLLRNQAEHTQMDQITVPSNLTEVNSKTSTNVDHQQINIWQNHNTEIINKLKEEKYQLVSQLENLKILNNKLENENQSYQYLLREFQIQQSNENLKKRDQSIYVSQDEIDKQCSIKIQENSASQVTPNVREISIISLDDNSFQEQERVNLNIYFDFWKGVKSYLWIFK